MTNQRQEKTEQRTPQWEWSMWDGLFQDAMLVADDLDQEEMATHATNLEVQLSTLRAKADAALNKGLNVVAFLVSCIRSGEQLSADDYRDIDAWREQVGDALTTPAIQASTDTASD